MVWTLWYERYEPSSWVISFSMPSQFPLILCRSIITQRGGDVKYVNLLLSGSEHPAGTLSPPAGVTLRTTRSATQQPQENQSPTEAQDDAMMDVVVSPAKHGLAPQQQRSKIPCLVDRTNRVSGEA